MSTHNMFLWRNKKNIYQDTFLSIALQSDIHVANSEDLDKIAPIIQTES